MTGLLFEFVSQLTPLVTSYRLVTHKDLPHKRRALLNGIVTNSTDAVLHVVPNDKFVNNRARSIHMRLLIMVTNLYDFCGCKCEQELIAVCTVELVCLLRPRSRRVQTLGAPLLPTRRTLTVCAPPSL